MNLRRLAFVLGPVLTASLYAHAGVKLLLRCNGRVPSQEQSACRPGQFALLLVLCCLGAREGYAQDCIDYRDHIHWLGGTRNQGGVADLVVVDGIAFTSADGGRFEITDVADPQSPETIGVLDLSTQLFHFCVSASLALVCMGDAGLAILDVSVPSSPEVLANLDTPDTANDVAVSGSYAFVADGYSGVQVVDIADPRDPSIIAALDTPGLASGIVVLDQYAYLCDGPTGLKILDIVDPMHPRLVGSLNTPGCASQLAVEDGRAFIADCEHGLLIADITNPASPAPLGAANTRGSAVEVSVADGLAYIADGYLGGLAVVAVSDPFNPVILAEVTTSDARCVSFEYPLCYLGTNPGIDIYDMRVPTMPPTIGSVDTPGDAVDLAVQGIYAYVADGTWGLSIVSLESPAQPVLVGGRTLPDRAIAVEVRGSVAFVATGTQLAAVDVSSPLNPTILDSEHYQFGGAQDLVVSEPYCYVANGYWIAVFDVSAPQQLTLVGSTFLSAEMRKIVLQNGRIYGVSEFGVHVIDLTYPEYPEEIGSLELPQAEAIDCQDDVALVGGWQWLAAVDITDPASPMLVDRIELPANTLSIVRSGRYGYLASGKGACVVDVLDPLAMAVMGEVETPGYAQEVDVTAGFAVLAGASSGIQVVPVQCAPPTGVIDQEAPAGFGIVEVARVVGGMSIAFDAGAQEEIRLAIYDCSGHLLQVVVDGAATGGVQHGVWNGRSARGARVASGIYVASLYARQAFSARKFFWNR